MAIMIVMVQNNKSLTSRHEKAPESFDSETLEHDYYIWVKKGNLRKRKTKNVSPEWKWLKEIWRSGIIAEKIIKHLCKV